MQILELNERPEDSVPAARLFRIEDRSVGLRAYLAIHDGAPGPAFGGLRRRVYASDEEAIREVLGLARGMALKLAFVGLKAGAAKAVILDQPEGDPQALYEAMGRALKELGSIWVVGPDVGTLESHLAILRQQSSCVNAEANDAAAATVRGVLQGLKAAVDFRFGSPDLKGRRVLIQGLGSVGVALAEAVLLEGAQLSVSEVRVRDAEAMIRAWAARGFKVDFHPPLDLISYQGDVVMPCAMGGFIDLAIAFGIQAEIICGSANEILSQPGLAQVLHEREVLMVPDFTVNAGAVIEGVIVHREGNAGRAAANAMIEATGARVRALLEQASLLNIAPYDLALQLASRTSS